MASCVATMQVAPAAVQTAGQALGGKNALVSAFVGNGLKKHEGHASFGANTKGKSCIVCQSEEIQTDKDRWKGLVYDISDDQQDIARGKGMVDALFQGPQGGGTQTAIMSSLDYINTSQRLYNMDNMKDGYYIAPAFMDKLVVHISKNFINLPNIKVPLILGIWGGKGQGKSFQCELVFAKMGINPIMMSAGELESGNAGEPAKLIRQRYREAADVISKKGQMCVLFINDLDAGAGRMGGTTQYTVNNQMVNATLMNIADNPTSVQLPGVYSKQEIPRVPIIVTGNDFSTLYAPLIRDGRMEKFYWAPTREDRIGVCQGIFKADGVHPDDVVKLVDTFPGQSIDFFGALRARVYDDEVRNWIGEIGVENMGAKLVNSKEGPPKFKKPAITIEKLLEYGYMLVKEQENVKRVQLAEKYMSQAALGDANEDAIKQGMFYGKAAQQVDLRVPEGCTDPGAANFDPTARSDDGTCIYDFQDNSTTGDGALKDGAKEAVASTAEETAGTLEAANKEENSKREVTPALEEVVKQEDIEQVQAKVEDSPLETVGKSESSNKLEDAKQPELKAASSGATLAAKQVELSSAAKVNQAGEAAKVEQPAASPGATPAVEQVAKVEQSPAPNLKSSNQVGEVDKKQPEIKSASTNKSVTQKGILATLLTVILFFRSLLEKVLRAVVSIVLLPFNQRNAVCSQMQAIGHGESVSIAKRNLIIQAGNLYGFARLSGLLKSIALAEDCTNQPCPAITQKVFFDIAIDGEPAGRIVVGLYGDEVPIGAKRFGEIAVGQKGVSYRKRDFTRITRTYIQNSGLRTFTLSGRDKDIARFTGGLTAEELIEEMKSLEQKGARPKNVKGSVSIVAIDAKKPPAKPKLITRDGKFEVVYEESRPDPNGTEFCIAYDDAPELDPTNLVVGRVVEGMEVVGKLAGTRVVQDNTSNPYFQTAKLIGDTRAVVAERGFNRPYSKIVISKSGSID